MFTKKMKIITFILVSAMLLSVCLPVALAQEITATASVPDLTVIIGSTGDKIGNANIYVDGRRDGKTNAKGNYTFTQAPAAGNHTLLVTAKNMNNVTLSTDFSQKPLPVAMTVVKGGKTMTLHVQDSASKSGIEGVSVYNNNYLMGKTNATGDLTVNNVSLGLYLIKFNKDGYKSSTGVMIALSNKTQSYSMKLA